MDELVNLICECGKEFTRKKVPDKWMENIHFKWKFRYCDNCFKEKVKAALKRLPEVVSALVEAAKKGES